MDYLPNYFLNCTALGPITITYSMTEKKMHTNLRFGLFCINLLHVTVNIPLVGNENIFIIRLPSLSVEKELNKIIVGKNIPF